MATTPDKHDTDRSCSPDQIESSAVASADASDTAGIGSLGDCHGQGEAIATVQATEAVLAEAGTDELPRTSQSSHSSSPPLATEENFQVEPTAAMLSAEETTGISRDAFLNDLDDRVNRILCEGGVTNEATINDYPIQQPPTNGVPSVASLRTAFAFTAETSTTDAFLNDLDDRVNRKLQEGSGGAPNNSDSGLVPNNTPTSLAVAANNTTKEASTVVDHRQCDIEKTGMVASSSLGSATASSTNTRGQSTTTSTTRMEHLVPGAYATPGRAPFARTTMSSPSSPPTASVAHPQRQMHCAASSLSNSLANSVASSNNDYGITEDDDYLEDLEHALEVTAVCVDHGALEHQIREDIINSAPRADAVRADDEDSSKANVDKLIRKTRRRYAIGASIMLVLMLCVVVGVILVLVLKNAANSDNDSEVAMEVGMGNPWKDGKQVEKIEMLDMIRYKGFLSCAVVGDPLWDSMVNQDFVEKGKPLADKPDSGGKVRKRFLQTAENRANVDTESGPFRGLPSWKKDKLLDRAATNKEYDICRAMAAAIFGDSWKTKLKIVHAWDWHVSATNEFDVDLFVGTLNPTIDNDVFVAASLSGFTFSTPYFYQGLRFAGRPTDVSCAESLTSGSKTVDEYCNSIAVCVRETSLSLEDSSIFPGLGSVLPNQTVSLGTDDNIFHGLLNGTCQVLADYGTTLMEESARQAGFTGEYTVGSYLVSKEPLVIAYYDKVPEYLSFLNWVLLSLFAAADEDITQSNAEEFPQTTAFGEDQRYAFSNAIKAVGNMKEILFRDGISLAKGISNDDSSAGLIIPYPIGPAPYRGRRESGAVIDQIMKRGRLRCGIRTGRPGLGERLESGFFSGLDADYCRGVAAALFPTVASDHQQPIEFVEFSQPRAGFDLLSSGKADIIAGILRSFPTEAQSIATGLSYSFSQPYYYRQDGDDSSMRSNLDNLCLVTLNKDTQWKSFVYWVVAATITAEERGIAQVDAESMPIVGLFGSDLETMFQSVIASIGNYDEIYTRNLERILPRSGRNRLERNPQSFLSTYIPPGLF